MPIPSPTPILRLIHLDNLHIYLQRGGIHAPNFEPTDSLVFRTIHNADIQANRRKRSMNCGPCGVIHDYVPFYFGYLSPMMLNLKTGRVPGYSDGQDHLIYLVSTAQAVHEHGVGYIFSDGHGIARFTQWFDSLSDLDKVDWSVVNLRYWKDTVDDMDRQRRKQAEFLVYRFCDWALISEIVVIDRRSEESVKAVMARSPAGVRRPVRVDPEWYYY